MDEWVAEFEPASKDGIDVRDEMRAKAKLVDPVVVGRFERNLANDGHDQMALRAVLYRHRTDLFDLPKLYNCRFGNVPLEKTQDCLVRHGAFHTKRR